MLTAATAFNLERKAHWADHVQIREGVPLPSWIDLNLTELCNRKCVFCPRVNPEVYPNQPLHMSVRLAGKIASELRSWKFEGAVVLCGFGEPLLHPRIVDIVEQFGQDIRVEIVTNGDRLDAPLIARLGAAGVDFFNVSMYDGPQQIAPLTAMFKRAGCSSNQYLLRDRWHAAEQDYGLKLTNRAGTINVGHQPDVDQTAPCFYVGYSLALDWNGDVLLCVQDWTKRLRFGNASSQSLWDIWTSKVIHKRRMILASGRRDQAPCSGCNADGCLHGAGHIEAWASRA